MTSATPKPAAPAATAAQAPRHHRHGGGLQLSLLDLLDPPSPAAAGSTAPSIANGPAEVVDERDARRRLAIGKRRLRVLVAAGALHRPAPGHVALPTSVLADIFRAWSDAVATGALHADPRTYARVRGICGASFSTMPPDAVLLEAGATMDAAGGSLRVDELAAMLAMPAKAAGAALDRLHVLLATPRDTEATQLPDAPMSMEAMVAAVPALAGARETCLDPNAREQHDEPGPRSRARLAATGPLIGPVALFLVNAAAHMRREQRLEHHMLMHQRFATTFASLRPGATHRDPQAIAAALEHVAFSPHLDGAMPAGVRDMVCRSWLMLTDVNDRYARGADPDGVLGLLDLVPARHPDEAGFRKRLRDHFRQLRIEAREQRKSGSDPLADTLSDKCGRFWSRMEQLGIVCEDARLAAGQLIGPRRPADPPYHEYLVTIPVLKDDGRHVAGHSDGHEQEDRWRAWPEDAFRASLGLPPRAEQPDLDLAVGEGPRPHASRNKPRLIFERVGARASLGGVVVKPFFQVLFDNGVLARPTGLDRRTLARRDATLRQWKAPAPLRMPEGLLWFDVEGEDLWRHAIARGRTIAPLDEFETGVMFAELGLDVVLTSLCRGHVFMQIEQSAEGWPLDKGGGTTAAGLCISAIDKTPAGKDPERALFPVLDHTLPDAMELAARVAAAAGRTDGIVPDVPIEERCRWKLPEPRPYVFQWAGEALRLSQVGHMLRVLLANIADVSFHDFRHACAADLFDFCEAPEIVQKALGHTSSMWRYYARRTERMQRRRQAERRRERQAELAVSETGRRRAA